MQRLVAIASFLFLAVVCAHAQTRSAVSLLQPSNSGEPFSKSIALVIGIDGYNKGWRPLDKAVEDARAIAAALPHAGFDEVVLKLNLDSASLERTIKDFIYVKGADPNARLLIWFAGHGHMIAEDGYLVPRDAPDPGNTAASEAAFQSVALPLTSFNRYMSEVKARHVLAVFDSCFSGAVFNSSRASVAASIAKSTGLIARQFISSGSYHEEAYDDGAFRRAFVEAISGTDAKALRDDGFLTGSKVGAYLAERISEETKGRQNPIYATSNVVGLDRGDFVFPLRYEAGNAPQGVIALPPSLPSELDAAPPELRIERVETTADDMDVRFLGDKLARNLVEYYVNNNVYVSSELTGREPARPPTHTLHASVSGDGERAVMDLELTAGDGRTISAGSFSAGKAFLRENYKVLPATAHYMLDVSLRTLTPLRSANRPTNSGEAYAMFLVARQKASRRQFQAAADLLEQAIEVDDAFAAAHAARAQLSIHLGEPRSVFEDHMAMAAAIDPDFPPLSIFGDEQMGDPVPALRAEAVKTPWQPVRAGLEYRRIETVDYAVSVLAWRYQESELDVKLAKSMTTLGETVEEFRKRTDAVLAINAGFFDLDFQSRLSPVGLLVVDGREIQSFDEDKAANPLTGILFVKNGRLGVIRAKDYSAGDRFESALQTGPLVVDPGGKNGIYRNSYDRQNRSAICLSFDGTPTVVQVSGGLSLYELGELLSTGESDGGFGCERAINLDGGPSSQISFLADGLGVEVPGLWKVGSSLILTAR